MAETKATFAELRQQIPPNAIKVFSNIFNAYLQDSNANANRQDVFDIVISSSVAIDGRGVVLKRIDAAVTYGNSGRIETALRCSGKPSRYEALLDLLEGTEALLAQKSFDQNREMEDLMGGKEVVRGV